MLSHIFHISDIHIRNGDHQLSRYDEYNEVISNLFSSIKEQIDILQLSSDQFIIIISGDVFHNKNVIGSYGLNIFKNLIKGLTNIGKTIVFHGNHDRFQNDELQPSLVACTMEIDNLTILRETTSFIIDDVGFSYVSIDDTLCNTQTVGRNLHLPPFPKIQGAVKQKVALFHGTFNNVKLYNGSTVDETYSPYPFEWLSNCNFDFALLGDIHLRQYGTHGKTLWGYAGSLVQQNYGEDIINHGYMIWNIKNYSVSEVNVYNPKGYINIKAIDNVLMLRIRGSYTHLENYIIANENMFPKHADIKLHSDVDINVLISLFQKYNITCNIVNRTITSDDKPIENTTNDNIDTDIQISKHTLLSYFQKYLSAEQQGILSSILQSYDNLLFDVSKFPDELKDECHKKNKELNQLISSCIKADDVKKYRAPFIIKYLEWKNIYCYEDVSWIDFDKTSFSTFLVTGNNGTGKSAIYDALTLALWGEITTSKQNNLSSGIINCKHKSAYALIDIEMNGIKYRVYRTFTINDGRKYINKAHNTLYKYSGTSLEVLKKENACNEEVLKLFGTMNDFLTTSMVTQNNDFDLLKMDYKACLATIDKAADIDYIFHLYNLLKGCLNKYKDLAKTTQSKKEVYERLLQQSKDIIDEKEIDDSKQKVQLLNEQKIALQDENNSIAIDLNNPDNKKILETDYHSLIQSLGTIHLTNEKEYNDAVLLYNELMVDLKAYSNKQIQAFLKAYRTDCIQVKPEKPCDPIIIQTEKKELAAFKTPPVLLKTYSGDLTDALNKLKEDLLSISNQLQLLNDNKPVSVTPKSPYDLQTIQHVISLVFHNHSDPLQALKDYCSDNIKISNKKIDDTIITCDTYLMKTKQLDDTKQLIANYKEQLHSIDTDLKDLHIKQQSLLSKPLPDDTIQFDNSGSIKEELDKYNLPDLKNTLDIHRSILDTYYTNLDDIHSLENQLASYKNELNALHTNDEYKFNPKCKICMGRSWVSRIKELNILIETLQHNIQQMYKELYDDSDHDYLQSFMLCEETSKLLDDCILLQSWYDYYTYKETYDLLLNDMRSLMLSKDNIQTCLLDAEASLKGILDILHDFNLKTHSLFDLYNNIIDCDLFSNWKQEYDSLSQQKKSLESEIDNLNLFILYHSNIQPRISKLHDLDAKYNLWEQHNLSYLSHAAYMSSILKSNIDQYSMFKQYTHQSSLQPLIKRKIEICDTLLSIDKELLHLNSLISKNTNDLSYQSLNLSNFHLLSSALLHINNTISLIETIIDVFKNFRKDIYDNIILSNIVRKTNSYINNLCHPDTKPFLLDYFISEVKDVLHINWLVRTLTDDNIKQVISIQQASGFQQFAISLALRMSIYPKKLCSQLFIDEGFTSCDKLNLSIVPYFLKSLLKSFHSLIIVSHIDIIQDTVDLTANISFHKSSNSSRIRFGNRWCYS